MTPVFLDTVGLLALWDTADQWHAPASRAFSRLQGLEADLFTTTYVLAETANAAARKPYRSDVDALREKLETGRTLIVPSDDDWRFAWQAYRQGVAGDAGLVDHLSFVVMRRSGIRDCVDRAD